MTTYPHALNRSLTLCLLIALVAPLPVAAQDGLVLRYRLTELEAEDGGPTRAYAINNTGQAIGYVEVEGRRHSAYWHNESMVDLHGTVHFDLQHPLFDQDYSESYDISDAGQVVGTARTEIECPPTFVITNAFVLRPAVLTDLATPYPGDALANLLTLGHPCLTAYDSVATGISNSNHVVGWADREDGTIHAFLVTPVDGRFFSDEDADFVNDYMIDLGTLAASDPVSSATAVNDSGWVTGYSYTTAADGTAAYRAFLVTPVDTGGDGVPDEWFAGADGVNNLMTDLGTLGGTNSWGRDINDDGDVVGDSNVDADSGEHYSHAFFWHDGAMTDLGTLRDDPTEGFSAASAINDSGVIVGWAENEDRQHRAFVYEDGQMTDLNDLLYLVDEEGFPITPRIVLTEARDINADGVIIGWGTIGTSVNAETRGFLLNPVMVDPDALEQAEEAASGNGQTSGSNGTTNLTTSPLIVGTPGNLATPSEDSTEQDETSGAAPLAQLPLFCGAGTLAFLPLTLAGLCYLRAGTRTRAARRR